jgi:hypothetical protein
MIRGSLSKPPPSATRPPHRGKKLSINEIGTYAPGSRSGNVPENCRCSFSESTLNGVRPTVQRARPKAAVLFADTMLATDWPKKRYSHEPPSFALVERR